MRHTFTSRDIPPTDGCHTIQELEPVLYFSLIHPETGERAGVKIMEVCQNEGPTLRVHGPEWLRPFLKDWTATVAQLPEVAYYLPALQNAVNDHFARFVRK